MQYKPDMFDEAAACAISRAEYLIAVGSQRHVPKHMPHRFMEYFNDVLLLVKQLITPNLMLCDIVKLEYDTSHNPTEHYIISTS